MSSMIGMIKMSDKCQKQYDFAEKKCLSAVKSLRKHIPKKKRKNKKEEEDTMAVLNTMFFM